MLNTRRVIIGAIAIVLAIAVPATPAWAHAKLTKSDPAANSTVTTAVTAISLTFNELVKQQNTTIVVTGPDGVSYSDGAATRVDKVVTQAVKPLPAGAINVAWQTVSADGDPISGKFAFTNAAAPPSPTAAAVPSPSPSTVAPTTASASTPNPQSASSDSGGTGLWWILVVIVAVLLAGVGGLLWYRRRAAP